ncbi:MAG: phage tail family protein [Eubacteriales bacterium]|nr:phage tail family protein [Eubacteriales bacterium]
MHVEFENEFGKIHMSGGGQDVWRITTIEGLGPAQHQGDTVIIKGRDGQVTSSLSAMARTITIQGDISARNSRDLLISASNILSKEGYLKIGNGTKHRKIKARPIAFIPEREYGGIRSFVLQFICDDPFFTDIEINNKIISSVEKLLYKYFTIQDGIYFSKGSTKCVINNQGFKETEPIISISNIGEAMQGQKLNVHNETTGHTIIVNHSLTPEDRVTIDIPNRLVFLNNEKRFDILDENSFLSDFYLQIGMNTLSIDTGNSSDRLLISCKYDNKYVEAIM